MVREPGAVPRGCHEARLPIRNDVGAFTTGSTGLSGSGHRVDRATREPTQGVCVVILEAIRELERGTPYSRPSRGNRGNSAPTCARGLELRRPRLPCALRSAEYPSRSVHIEGLCAAVGAE